MAVWPKAIATAAMLGIAAGLSTTHAQDISASQRALVERYVTAITAQDVAALKALYHPAMLACANSDNRDYFEFLYGNDLKYEADLKAGYTLSGFRTIDPNMATIDSMGGLFPPPVAPTHQFQIDSTSGTANRSLTILRMAAEHDGAWFIVAGCPTAKGLATFRERRDEGARQQARVRELADKLSEPLLSEIKELLAQNRRVEAIKRYQNAVNIDLTTAAQVIDALGKPSQ